MTTKKVHFGDIEIWSQNSVEFYEIDELKTPINSGLIKFINEFIWPSFYQRPNDLWIREYKNRINLDFSFNYQNIENLFLKILTKLKNNQNFILNYRKMSGIPVRYKKMINLWFIRVHKHKDYCASIINHNLWLSIIKKKCKKYDTKKMYIISKTSGNKIKMIRQISTGIYNEI